MPVVSPETELRSPTSSLIRPRLRGVADIFAAAVSIPAILLLVDHAASGISTLVAAVYGASLVILLVGSAIYHRDGWSLRVGLWLRKIDHANIYLMIAGSATPIVATLMPGPGRGLLIAMWTAAAAGILKTFAWPRAPRQLNSAIYTLIGCIPVPFAGQIGEAVGDAALQTLALGGAFFIVGGVVYARRWPNPNPFVFGYHEIFHLFVFTGAALHYSVIWDLVA